MIYPELQEKYDWINNELENGEWVRFYDKEGLFLITDINDVQLGENYLVFDNGERFALLSDTKLLSTRLENRIPARYPLVDSKSNISIH